MELLWRRPGRRRVPVVPILYGLMHICTPVYFVLNIVTTCIHLGCKVCSDSSSRYTASLLTPKPSEVRFSPSVTACFITYYGLSRCCLSIYTMSRLSGVVICVLYSTWAGLCHRPLPLAFPLIFAILVISALRVYAINPRDRMTPSAILILSLVPVATNIVCRITCGTPCSVLPMLYCHCSRNINFLAPDCTRGLEGHACFRYLRDYTRRHIACAGHVGTHCIRFVA